MTVGKQTTTARVDTVQPNSAAQRPASSPATWCCRSTARKIDSFSDMQRIVSISAGEPLKIVVERGGVPVDAERRRRGCARSRTISAMCTASASSASAARWRPATSRPRKWVRCTAVVAGAQETWFVVDRTLSYIGGVFTGREAADQLGGPIRIAQVSGQVATAGFAPLVHLTAVLSVSIGLLNLFPIPLLDGGHLLFYGIEAVPRPAAVGAGPGGRISHRAGNRCHVDDFCNL